MVVVAGMCTVAGASSAALITGLFSVKVARISAAATVQAAALHATGPPTIAPASSVEVPKPKRGTTHKK
jgi:hypothetical protein